MLDLVDIGRLALGLALGLAAFQVLMAGLAVARRTPELAISSRNASAVLATVMTTAVVTLAAGFLTRDFSIAFVADHSSSAMPVGLTLAALWGGQEGSLLYWAWMLSLFGAVAAWRMLRRDASLGPWGLAVLGSIQLFFTAVLVFASSPFERLAIPPPDGRGLNPLLWDSGMQIHPPMLLMGYLSFTVPFAFALAMLLRGQIRQAWLREMRNWMLLAWTIQSAGLLLGAWWAYRVLGWGGYWGWDPVENVALLPWLVATAYIHSALAQERRGQLRAWSVGLVLATFGLAVFGTFVVRSGILTSVHSFALSDIGPLFLVFTGAVLILATGAFIYRLPMLRSPVPIQSFSSKEAGFLLNNLVLISIAIATFWGTVFPIVSEIVRGGRMAVGPPFYEQVNVPLLVILLGLLAVWPLLAWRRTSLPAAWRATRWPLAVAIVTSVLLAVLGMRHGLAVLALSLTALVVAGVILEYGRGLWAGLRLDPERRRHAVAGILVGDRRRLGSYIVHLGIAVFAIGIIASASFKQETTATLRRGETVRLDTYAIRYDGLRTVATPGLTTVAADLDLTAGGTSLGTLRPTRRIHRGWENQPTSDVAISTTLPALDDVYVLLTGWVDNGESATLRVLINPLVSLLWVGGLIYFAGVVMVAWPAAARRPVTLPASTERVAAT